MELFVSLESSVKSLLLPGMQVESLPVFIRVGFSLPMTRVVWQVEAAVEGELLRVLLELLGLTLESSLKSLESLLGPSICVESLPVFCRFRSRLLKSWVKLLQGSS